MTGINIGGHAIPPPPVEEFLLLEDGDFIILEDGTGFLLLE